MVRRMLLVSFVIGLFVTRGSLAADWITAPSYYTHDATGNRVRQHTPIGPFYTYPRGDFSRSGYHHTRSSLQFGGSVDHYHVVEEWGRPVRPYDEWRFPYRPYSAPYEAWGPPFAGLGPGAYPFFPYNPYRFQPVVPGAGANPNPPVANPPVANPNPPVGNPNPPGVNPFPGGVNPFQPFVPYRGYQPWFDDRYPAFDDRAPWRREPFPVVPNVP